MSYQMEIAKTIKSQIIPTELWAIGAKNYVALSESEKALGGLAFDASLFGKRRCKIIITLNHRDLYNVELQSAKGTQKACSDVFCEDLTYSVVKMAEEWFNA